MQPAQQLGNHHPLCTWCGHPAHEGPCPRTITTKTGKQATAEPCPCAWRKAAP